MSNYTRTLPRDLFNEAKLLKCLGRLFLAEVDGELSDLVTLRHNDDESIAKGFIVDQDPSDGSIYVQNISIFIDGQYWTHCCDLNSKNNYPLRIVNQDDEEYYVFDDNGKLMPDFLIRKEVSDE